MKKTDATNLHSFFVGNLEKAKTLSTSIIDAYILGKNTSELIWIVENNQVNLMLLFFIIFYSTLLLKLQYIIL